MKFTTVAAFLVICIAAVASQRAGNSNSQSILKRLRNLYSKLTGIGKCNRLRGANRSGAEFSCVENKGIFDGPTDDAAIKVMKSWNLNAVRLPMNEDCWLGINGHPEEYSGANYRKAVVDYVKRLRKHGMTVILDLQWTDGLYQGESQGKCYDYRALCQKPMPDKENAPAFWKSVASQFKNDNGVIFDLFNEPFPDRAIKNETQAWLCLRDGGKACPGIQYEVAGMQDLVNAVRSTGAKNTVMVSGLSYTNDLSRWMEFVPHDSANNVAASWHSYDFNACTTKECWEKTIAPILKSFRLIVGEIGQEGCKHDYIDPLMKWLDDRNVDFLGWTWNNWDCSDGPSLIKDYDGTPTDYGVGFKNHLAETACKD